MRFVLVSTHTDQTTGYAKVAHNLLKQLATLSPKVKVFHFAFQRHAQAPGFRKAPDGVVQYDAAANEDPKEEGFGFNKIREYLDMVNPDVVMIYNDPLIIYKFLETLKYDKNSSPFKLWAYVDQVYDGIAQPLMEKIRTDVDRVYAFTDIWKEKLTQYGNFTDVRILEHAVDTAMFTRLPADVRMSVRKNLGIPQDAVAFLNMNRNSQRKRLDLTIAGFVRLIAKNPDKPYYLVVATNLSPQSGAYYDVPRIFTRELTLANLPQIMFTRLVLVDTAPPNVIADEGVNQLYNAIDIGINTSDGEGFGLCQLEHMYTGAPQIVVDIGSYRSFLNESVATFIPVDHSDYFPGSMPLGGWSGSAHPTAVGDAMEQTIARHSEMTEAIQSTTFKTWAGICDEFLEDVLSA
jgi:glycosyltransferase involved in cell wall biosynthesis